MKLILSVEQGEEFELTNAVKDSCDESLQGGPIFLTSKKLPVDGAGRSQIEVTCDPSKFRAVSEMMQSVYNTGALEVVEEAIINNTIGDIDEINIMEERIRSDEEEDAEDEEGAEKIGAIREIAEMEIDRDLMASVKGGIQASKKKRKKKKNRKKK
jgi:hypothetical protein